jgi:uncharacterized protein YjbJ (UPF0337 family)
MADEQKEGTMSFLDKLKGKATEAVDKHGDKVGDAVDKAKTFIDDKTGGKLGKKGDAGAEQVKDALDGLDGKDDDIK